VFLWCVVLLVILCLFVVVGALYLRFRMFVVVVLVGCFLCLVRFVGYWFTLVVVYFYCGDFGLFCYA